MRKHQVPYRLVTETAQVDTLVERWQGVEVLAVDTETAHRHQLKEGKSRISLLQVWDGVSEEVVVVDCFAASISRFVTVTMRNPDIVKLIHNAPCDLAFLGGAAQARSVVCTQQMARRIPPERRNGLERHSLKALSEHFLGIELNKIYQASNWAVRPLSKQQLAYAALDPWITYRIWEHMRPLAEPSDEEKDIEELVG